MACAITPTCTRCGACIDVCPDDAIQLAQPIYRISETHCTECVGFAPGPVCVDACEPKAIQLPKVL
jgi:ferredoxin